MFISILWSEDEQSQEPVLQTLPVSSEDELPRKNNQTSELYFWDHIRCDITAIFIAIVQQQKALFGDQIGVEW